MDNLYFLVDGYKLNNNDIQHCVINYTTSKDNVEVMKDSLIKGNCFSLHQLKVLKFMDLLSEVYARGKEDDKIRRIKDY